MGKSITNAWGTTLYNHQGEEYYHLPNETENQGYRIDDPEDIEAYGIFNGLFDVSIEEIVAYCDSTGIPVYTWGQKIVLIQEEMQENGLIKRMEIEMDFEQLYIETRTFADSLHISTDRADYKRYLDWIIPIRNTHIYYGELPSGIRYQTTQVETYHYYAVAQDDNWLFNWYSGYEGDECDWILSLFLHLDTSTYAQLGGSSNYSSVAASEVFDELLVMSWSHLFDNGLSEYPILMYDTIGNTMVVGGQDVLYLARQGDAMVYSDSEDNRVVLQTYYDDGIIAPCNLADSTVVNHFMNIDSKLPIQIDHNNKTIHLHVDVPLIDDEYFAQSSGASMSQQSAFGKQEKSIQQFEEIQKRETKISVYPNPANEQITIVLPFYMDEQVEVEILSALGVTVLSQHYAKGERVEMDIRSLSPGFYVIRCTNADKREVFTRFIKQ